AHAAGFACLAQHLAGFPGLSLVFREPSGDQLLQRRVEPDQGHIDSERNRGRGHRGRLVEGVLRAALQEKHPEGARRPFRTHRGRARARRRPSISAVPTTPPGCLRPSGVPWKSLPAVTSRPSSRARFPNRASSAAAWAGWKTSRAARPEPASARTSAAASAYQTGCAREETPPASRIASTTSSAGHFV